ncbi:Niemann-Pick C2 protein [Clonorchis sinensis]|uniref:Niemann-Pick C2 protein n=1 Tax=Clonorchis sinensis TaxID=79923 RepID=G7YJT5_CLOSI|nr:Niemann-Pick C2 protein [Clonorchis sinensis]
MPDCDRSWSDMHRLTAILLILLPITSGFYIRGTQYKTCDGQPHRVQVLNVSIEPCDTRPCTLYKGERTKITINFTTAESISPGKASVHGIIAGIPMPFTLEYPDVCNFTEPGCPLTPGVPYGYSYQLPVSSSYPSIHLTVKWELMDAARRPFLCVEMPVKLHGR